MLTDEESWLRFLAGDQEMFISLYRKYHNTLYFIGLKELKDGNLAKDIIHQQFVYLWEKRNSLGEVHNVKSYLITSFMRRLNNDWKTSVNKNKLHIAWSASGDTVQLSPEEVLIINVEHKEKVETIKSQIESLPPRLKELILLKYYDNLSYEEISQKTGLSLRTIYNKVHEAIKIIKLRTQDLKAPINVAKSILVCIIGLLIT